jgi:hypothetical protein
MGYYINENSKGEPAPAIGKAKFLMADGATPIQQPDKFQAHLVCVVDNGLFEAAGFVFDEREFEDWGYPDQRRRQWLLYEHASNLSGYAKYMEQFGSVRG